MGTWDDKQCNLTFPFICYSNLTGSGGISLSSASTGIRTVVRVKISTDGALANPVFSEEVLQHLCQELINKGMSADATLRWRTQPNGQVFHLQEHHDTGITGLHWWEEDLWASTLNLTCTNWLSAPFFFLLL
ncbi:C-type lectin lectoxin-Thr1-like isoform X2 [Arapaima gigas]